MVDINNSSPPRDDRPFLVTGAAGFTGSHLARQLLLRGYRVRAFVRNASNFRKLGFSELEVVEGDLKSPASVEDAVRGTAGIFHIAALFRQAGFPDQEYFDVNVEGTRRLLSAAIQHKVPRFVYCSTIGVQGHINNPPATEEHPYNPGDAYQISKMEAEKLVLQTFAEGKVHGVVIRPAMIYGPGDNRILKLFKMISQGRFFYVGKGKMHVHFVDVRDLVGAFVTAMERTQINGEIYTIAGARAYPLDEAVGIISKNLGVKPPWLHIPVRPMQWLGTVCEAICTPLRINPPLYRRRVDFYTKNRHFDCSKAVRDLTYQPRTTFEQEVRDIIRYYQEHGLIASATPKTSRMVRDLDGRISDWDTFSEKTYGWSRDSAVGKVSHSLLKTEFPCSLEEINQELITQRVWNGPLVHTRRDGNKVKVASRWELTSDYSEQGLKVVEINEPHEEYNMTAQPFAFPMENFVGSLICSFGELADLIPTGVISAGI